MSLLDDDRELYGNFDLSVYKIHERLAKAEEDIKSLNDRCIASFSKQELLNADNKLIRAIVDKIINESVQNFDKLDELKTDLMNTKTAVHQLEDTVKLLAKEILSLTTKIKELES